MNVAAWVSLVVALIAAGSAYASQRAAAKASTINTTTTSRVDMEKEAYQRARTFDTETIRRQDEEITELRQENVALKSEVREVRTEAEASKREASELREDVRKLTNRVGQLEITNPHISS